MHRMAINIEVGLTLALLINILGVIIAAVDRFGAPGPDGRGARDGWRILGILLAANIFAIAISIAIVATYLATD